MPTRLLLEGPEFEPLLAQVREEHGPDFKIVSAEKVRSGGLAGFFAKQHYELAVELPDPVERAPLAPQGQSTEPVDSWLSLIEASQERYRSLGSENQPPPPRAALVSTAAPAFADFLDSIRRDASPHTPDSHEELLRLADSRDDSAQFADMSPRTADSNATYRVADAARFADTSPRTADNGSAHRVADSRDSVRFGDMLPRAADSGVAYRLVDDRGAGVPVADSLRGQASFAGLRDDALAAKAFFADRTANPVPASFASAPVADPAAEPVSLPSPPAEGERRPDAVHYDGLVALGMPEKLAALATDSDPYRAVVQALSTLPAAPPLPMAAGDILVVAGELTHALPIARAAAELLHLDPSKILLAGPTTAGTGIHPSRRISGPAEALRRARRMHRAEVPHVVVVAAPMQGVEDGWVRSVCDGLGATQVWAAVDASRKTDATSRHLDGMGRVDALAVYAPGACTDPASVLRLDRPVALLDGEPADPHAWAALLGPGLMPS